VAVENEFNAGTSKVKVDYWAVCKEPHKNGGFHYHCSVKLTGAKKWISVKTRLHSKYGVQVHFSDKHDFYLSSYRYVCKSDNEVAHSPDHPQGLLLTSSPQTKACSQASKTANRKRKAERTNSSTSKRHARPISNMIASEIIKSEKIATYTELLAAAQVRKRAGQTDLSNYVLSRTEKHLNEIIKKTWEMQGAEEQLVNESLTRMDIVRGYVEGGRLAIANGFIARRRFCRSTTLQYRISQVQSEP
jgi:hypothetical protein